MKYLKLAGVCLLQHGSACAFAALLTAYVIDPNPGLTIAAHIPILTAAIALLFGLLLRSPDADKNRCWNVAAGYYLVNLAALLLMWKFSAYGAYGDVRPANALGLAGQIWTIPSLSALAEAAGLSGDHGIRYLLLGAVLAAVEPLMLTLGLLVPDKKTKKEENEPHA